MADMTLLQGKQYVRSKVKELKNDAVMDEMLTADFNLASMKVQNDLLDVGIKQWTKTVFNTGKRVQAPSDLMPIPNAIRDLRASSGVKATLSTALTGANNDLVFTSVEPGTPGNIIQIAYLNDTSQPNQTIIVVFSSSTSTVINVYLDLTLPTDEIDAQSVMDAVNADIIASSLVVASLKTGNSGAGAVTAMTATSLTGGTGNGWKPADEIDLVKKNRIMDSYIEKATENFPRYCLTGDASKRRIIELLPATIKYWVMEYWYTVTEMTADTDTIGIHFAFRELVLLEVIRKCYETLEMAAKMQEAQLSYTAKLQDIEKKYQNSIASSTQDKIRLQSADVNN